MKLKTIAIPSAIVVFLAFFYWPTFRWLVHSWLSNPYYSHGFLIPLVSGFFVWTKRGELKRGEPSIIGAYAVALGAFVYILGFVWGIRFLSAFSLLIVLGGLVLLLYGAKAARSMVFPLCFLIFMIPLPFIQEMGFHLQSISTDSSAWLLEVVGLSVTTVGPEIHVGDIVFTVGLPCSGINTLIALLALAAVYAYLLMGPLYKRAILFVIAFPIAILANIFRIAAVILVANNHGTDVAMGFFHDLSSVLFFLLAFLCLVLLGRLLRCRLRVLVLRRQRWN